MWNTVQEVSGAIQWIDDKTRLARRSFDLAAFFHQETPIGTRIFEFVKNRVFGFLVGLRNEISRTL